ncbi:DUF881 domain-containing protein [Blastococcus brunescens]|uniref:DUF881 domain-containing protein n=1 Tax=Blastococcus brunescens TaxID=1564165 RepID=A0ABZ1BA83_9ACTN|nr:DUF881 domain-containing protein [Blastococcus sp. BMG 8361]WRL66983.1 DUF881 domain-containing protein [Blastococcus sp. BMG 8361]
MAVAGVLVAITYQEAAASVQGRQQVRAALVDDIRRDSAITDELAGQLELLRTQLTSARDEVLAASAVGQRAADVLARAERDAAAVAVTGPGLLVTLANADPTADEDPVGGGTAQEDLRGRVKDGDLQVVVNALWAAGAEAISINGQRLGPTTAIRFAGEAVLVDFRPVTNPYEIRAIGDPDELSNAFLDSPEVEVLAGISKTFGLRFEFAEREELSLPAGGIPELDSARPEGRDAPAAEPDSLPGG